MASIYTHHRFGNELLKTLPNQFKVIAESNLPYYLLGQQGPDLFFFNPLTLMKEDSPGTIIHKQSGKAFIDNQINMLTDYEWNSAEMAYFIGSLCHYILDSHIHPQVNALSTEHYTHLDIETELDRYYLLIDGHNPFAYPLENLIAKETGFSTVIPKFYEQYPKGTASNVNLGIKFFRIFKRFFHSESLQKENFIKSLLKISGNQSFESLIIHQTAFAEAKLSNPQLNEIYYQALNNAPTFIENVFDYILNDANLLPNFNINYDGE